MKRLLSTEPRGASRLLCLSVLLTALFAAAAQADVAFTYEPIEDDIASSSFSVDFAAMTAHRTLAGYEMNFVQLVDCQSNDGLLPDIDLSDAMFGTAAFPLPPQIDMGPLETGVFSASIDASFFPALAAGRVGLRALFTDTADAKFAIDFVSLTIETDSEILEFHYGRPIGNENNGFGIGLPDGGDLPEPLPDALPGGSTGTGFDETISSKSILAIPEPSVVAMLTLGVVLTLRRRGLFGVGNPDETGSRPGRMPVSI